MAASDETSIRKEAMTHLMTGKRHMLVRDTPAALDSLAMSCEMISKTFGETSTECADAYFHYGRALLEMSRMESGVLGTALEGIPEEEDEKVEESEVITDDQKEEIATQVRDALDENFQTHEEQITLLTDGHTSQMPESDEEEEAEEAMETDVEKMPVEAEKVEDEDEPSNLQHAWEMLELAKVIYMKKVEAEKETASKAEFERKICETFISLGEVSLENENFEQAVEDFTACLTRRVATLPKDSRSIAEIHYQLGVALGFSSRFEEAVKSLNAAIDVLTMRITHLAERIESKDETRVHDAEYTRDKEMTELETLIPEIREKIADTNEMKAESMKAEATTGFTAGTTGEKPVTTISAKKRTNAIAQDGGSFNLKQSRLESCS